jgi:hypothetical protein
MMPMVYISNTALQAAGTSLCSSPGTYKKSPKEISKLDKVWEKAFGTEFDACTLKQGNTLPGC